MSARHANQRSDICFASIQAANSFKCAICRDVMVDPADVGCKNQHLFCFNCIQALPAIHKCPICRELCGSLRKMPYIERQIKSLQVKCKNHEISAEMANLMSKKDENQDDRKKKRSKKKSRPRSRDRSRSRSRSRDRAHNNNRNNKKQNDNDEEQQYVCSWIGSLADYENGQHICDFDIVSCGKCKKRVLRKILREYHASIKCTKCSKTYIKCQKHLCPKEEVKCKCGETRKRENIAFHHKRFCPEQVVECRFKKYGCWLYSTFKRKDEEAHDEANMSVHLDLVESKMSEFERRLKKLENK